MWNIIIPAGGLGRRLKHYTQNVPKSLVPIAGKSIIEHQLDAIPFETVRELVFITGYKEEVLRDFISQLELPFPVNFYHNDKYERSHCSFSLLKSREKMEEGFILLNSDLILSMSHFQMLTRSGHENVICAKKAEFPPSDLQKIKTDSNNKVLDWDLDLDHFHGEVMGPLKIGADAAGKLLNYCEKLSESEILQLPCFTLFSLLIRQIDFFVEYVEDYQWCEIDTVEDLEQYQEKLNQNNFQY